MIISHRHKFAFFRPPKTGTTSAAFFLRICGAFDGDDTLSGMQEHGLKPSKNLSQDVVKYTTFAHFTPKQAIDEGLITLDQLREYKSVAYIREPFKRTLSAIIHQTGRFCDPTYITGYIEHGQEYIAKNTLLNRPQSAWFYVDGELILEPMLMDNHELHLRSMIDYVGGISFPMLPALNGRGNTRSNYAMEEWLTPEFIAFVNDKYADDIVLYNQTKAKEI